MQGRAAFVDPSGLGVYKIGQRPSGKGCRRPVMACVSMRLLEVVWPGSSSGLSAVTFTAVLRAAMFSLTRYSVGRAERISMMPLKEEKPSLSTVNSVGTEWKVARDEPSGVVGNGRAVELRGLAG